MADFIRLAFVAEIDVAIISEWCKRDASPIACRSHRGTVVVGVQKRIARKIESGTDRVIGQARDHDREARLADHLERTTDAILDIQRTAFGSDRRSDAGLDDEAFVSLARQSQTTVSVVIGDNDGASQQVDYVRVIPNRFGGQRCTSNAEPIQGVAPELIVLNQRTKVSDADFFALIFACRSSRIPYVDGVERICIDTDSRCVAGLVVLENIVDDNRLTTDGENDCPLIDPSRVAVGQSEVGGSR